VVRPRTFDEKAVLDGAIELFRERGYAGTRIPDLTQALGICRQSLYATFGDKRSLFLKALDTRSRREVDAMLGRLAAGGSPLANVRALLSDLATAEGRPRGRGPLTAAALLEMPRDEDVMSIVETQIARLERGLGDALDRAALNGELPGSVHPAPLARALTAAICGAGLLEALPGHEKRCGDLLGLLQVVLDAPSAAERRALRSAAPGRSFEPGI